MEILYIDLRIMRFNATGHAKFFLHYNSIDHFIHIQFILCDEVIS